MKAKMIFGLISMVAPLTAYIQKVNEETKEIPVELAQLMFAAQGIFTCVDNEWISVNAIRYDANHGYLAVIQTRWICRKCLYNNPPHAPTCQRYYDDTESKCGYARPR